MKKTTLLLLVLGFFVLSSCEEMNGLVSTPAQPDGFSLPSGAIGTPAAGDGFTPPTRERGKTRLNVKSFGAVGDGAHDDTDAIQAAIDALPEDGGTVFVPPGAYLINGDIRDINRQEVAGNAIRLRSRMHLELSKHATLMAKPTNAWAHYIVYAYNVSDVEISGGKIIGERDQHSGIDSEGGRGIQLRGSDRVTIRNIHISKFWGDGISIGTTWAADPGPKIRGNDIVIDDVVATHNRRQGLSIGPATNVQVWDSEFSYTKGTSPQCGIDIEPEANQFTENVLIQNCVLRNNHAYGILLYKRMKNVTVKDCEVLDNRLAGIVLEAPVDTYLTLNEIHNNQRNGLVIKAGVDGVTVDQNTFYENNENPPRPSPLTITGMTEETERDIFIRPGVTRLNIDTNIYK